MSKKIKICVSDKNNFDHLDIEAIERAKELGREIARHDAMFVTNTSRGISFWSAMGAKEVGGFTIGFSPAATEKEHIEVYKLPTEYIDLIIYTGFGFAGRDLLMERSVDHVVENTNEPKKLVFELINSTRI